MIIKQETVQEMIVQECDNIKEMLLEKNRNYGNSAIDPLRIFSKLGPVEQIKVRLDDKLSRLARGHAGGEDVEKDLLGYLILMKIARRLHQPIDGIQTQEANNHPA